VSGINPETWEQAFRIVAAAVLGGMIGYERETHNRPAGLRTHILVCVGAALFTIISHITAAHQFDPGRIAAQIIPGIGFLGAGTIFRQGSIVRGLTTAASLWTVAGIGMAVGTGGQCYVLAVVATLVVMVTLTFLNWVEDRWILRAGLRHINVTFTPGDGHMNDIMNTLLDMAIQIETIRLQDNVEGAARQLASLQVKMPLHTDPMAVTHSLLALPFVSHVDWQ